MKTPSNLPKIWQRAWDLMDAGKDLPGLKEVHSAALAAYELSRPKDPKLAWEILHAFMSEEPEKNVAKMAPEAWAAMYPKKKKPKAKATPAPKKGKAQAKKKP